MNRGWTCRGMFVLVSALVLVAYPNPGHAQRAVIRSFTVGPDVTLTYPNNSSAPQHLVDLPDEHTTFMPLQPGGSSYLVFAASKISGGTGGAVALQTTDLLTFNFATALGYSNQVMAPPTAIDQCNATYQTEFDGNYAAPGSVVQDPTLPPGNLIMIYEAENHCPAGVVQQPFYATVGFARSSDNGKTWPAPVNGPLGGPSRHPVLQSSDPQPSVPHQAMGNAIPSAFVDRSANGDYFLYVSYIYRPATPVAGQGLIRVARAKLGQDPLTFMKWYNGSFSQPGIGGLDTGVTPGPGCINGGQAHSEISYNDDLGEYLMVFVCVNGPTGDRAGAWYYSTATSLDLQNWTAPQMIQNSQFPVTSPCSADGSSGGQFDGWYPSFMSPGAAAGHTRLTGQVFFMNGCDTGARQFMSRTFTITLARPPAITSISICSVAGGGGQGSCPAGSFDTHQIVLGLDGTSINNNGAPLTSDEHASVFAPGTLGSNQDYLFFVATQTRGNPDIGTTVLSGGSGPGQNSQWTLNFPQTDGYGLYPSGFGQVFNPPIKDGTCPVVADGNPAHQDQTFDIEYAAPGSVVKDPTSNPGSLLMIYEGVNGCVGSAGGQKPGNNDAYISLGIATSIDYGKTWPTYRGTSTFSFVPLPNVNLTQGPNAPLGALGSNVCMGNDCITAPPPNYGRYAVVTPSTSLASVMAAGKPLTSILGDQEIAGFLDDVGASPAPYLYATYNSAEVARAQLNGGSAPLSFTKWNGQAFASPGIGGAGSSVLPAVGSFENCEAPSQSQFGSSISYIDDTQQYLLTFVCRSPGDPAGGQHAGAPQGAAWFYSTSYDLSDQTQWTPPQEIIGSWSQYDTSGGCQNWKGFYPTLMSLGKKPGHLSTTGYVFYLWGCQQAGTPPPGRQYSSRVFMISTAAQMDIQDGGANTHSTTGGNGTLQTGYALVSTNSGNPPYGTAVFSLTQNGVVVSEVGVPASAPTVHGRIFIDFRTAVAAKSEQIDSGTINIDTGMALVNRGNGTAHITFALQDATGTAMLGASGSGALAVGAHTALFIDQLGSFATGFNLPANFSTATKFGSLDILSDQPLSILALRLTNNQRGDALLTSTPIVDMTQGSSITPLYFPQFADGGGYTMLLILLNTSAGTETGKLRFYLDDGSAVVVHQVGGNSNSTFSYNIPAGGVYVFQTDGSPASVHAGWVQAVPDAGMMAPVGAGVFSLTQGGILVTQSGVPSAVPTTHARIYVDESGGHDTGLAIANPSGSPMAVVLSAFQTDGVTPEGSSNGPVNLAVNGHKAAFAGQFITGLPAGFTGVLDITSAQPFAALTLRLLNNARGDTLLTTFPIADFHQAPVTPLVFPQIADGGGYQTQFIFLDTSGSASTVTLSYSGDNGSPIFVGKAAPVR